MSNTNDKQLLELVLPCLASMADIRVIDQYGGLGLTKEDKLFALINQGLLYLYSENLDGKTFVYNERPMTFVLFEDGHKLFDTTPDKKCELSDKLLHRATASYWLAKKRPEGRDYYGALEQEV
jgi:TfoX/Sxy family transcriptional regulator of competence genes